MLHDFYTYGSKISICVWGGALTEDRKGNQICAAALTDVVVNSCEGVLGTILRYSVKVESTESPLQPLVH